MTELFLSVAGAYLLGLALMGYVCLLVSIQLLAKRKKWGKLITTTLIGIHFFLGIGAMLFAPAQFYRQFSEILSENEVITFAVTVFFMICVVLFLAKSWNQVLAKIDDEP